MDGRDELIWGDDFDGAAGSPPNPAFWAHETGGHGWSNAELQNYTDRPENACQDGLGHLCIVARHGPEGYTSARLISKGLVEFQHGRLETRIKLPKGAGLWSAVWLLGSNIDSAPWPQCGEIDVVEHLGAQDRRVFGTVHCLGHAKERGISGDYLSDIDLPDDFHTFAVDWWAQEIVWSVDGHNYFRVSKEQLGASWVFDHPFYILINLAVGGWLGGDVSPQTRFPATLQVDYLRVFRRRPGAV